MKNILVIVLLLFSVSAFSQRIAQGNDNLVSVVTGFEPQISSHFVNNPSFGGQTDGAVGWRLTAGGKYYFDKELMDDVALLELFYQRIGAFGYYDDHRGDDFNFIKHFGGTFGYGVNLGATDFFIAGSLAKSIGDNIGKEKTLVEVGAIVVMDIINIGNLQIGGRFDAMYQAWGVTSLSNSTNNFPFRISGGINLTYEITKVYTVEDPRHF